MQHRLEPVELAIVGAGPAGLSAAAFASAIGIEMVLLDEQPRPGGQIFRRGRAPSLLPRFADDISAAYADPAGVGIDYRAGHAVWAFDSSGLHVTSPSGSYTLRARRTIIATGASEWVLPVPGWTTPGVVTAGGAQALLKSAGVVVGKRVVIAGTGPLLLQVAVQLLEAGAEIGGVIEVATRRQWLNAASRILAYPPAALQGISLLAALARRNVPIHYGCVPSRILGLSNVTGVEISAVGERDGKSVSCIKADSVCLSYGLLASLELAGMRGCKLRYSKRFGLWEVERDSAMRTSLEDVFAVGDGARISGARFAIPEGRIAACAAARDLGYMEGPRAERIQRQLRRRLARMAPLRGYLAAVFRQRPDLIAAMPADATLCRCEEVRVGDAREAIRHGVCSLHELRILFRVGMGPCQGRFCTSSALQLLAQETGRSLEELGSGSPRPPVRPVKIGDFTELEGI